MRLLHDRRALYTGSFTLSAGANRMAAPLTGDALAISDAANLVSEPVVSGTIQLPPDGHPVILLAEAQTVGPVLVDQVEWIRRVAERFRHLSSLLVLLRY